MQFNFNRKEYERKFLNPGGYVGKIINVIVEGEIIRVYFDIAQGEFKDTYMKEYKQAETIILMHQNGVKKLLLITIFNIQEQNMHLQDY